MIKILNLGRETKKRQQTESHRSHRRGRRPSSWKSLTFLWIAASILIRSAPPCEFAYAYTPRLPFLTRGTTVAIRQSPFSAKRIRQTNKCFMTKNLAANGLSRYYQGILSRTNRRQRFVTGKFPLIVTIEENPTLKWLSLGRAEQNMATSQVLVNETKLDRSLASYDRFQWIDEEERKELHNRYATVSLELLAEVHIPKPGYLHILPSHGAGASASLVRKLDSTTRWNRWSNNALFQELEDIQWNALYRDRLWVTGFSLAGRKGMVNSVDVHTGHIDSVNARSEAMTLWPNEVNLVPSELVAAEKNTPANRMEDVDDALLVSDGFLVPGKDRGGIYIIKNPSNPNSEWTSCLTSPQGGWFYHRAVWVDLTGDGRKSILTARAKLRKVGGKLNRASDEDSRPKNGQLVWLEMPKPHHFDEATGTPLEQDGTTFDPFSARHLPWKERVLAAGPDVMFNVADMDTEDDTIEVIASQFFDKKVTLHSIKKGPKPVVSFSRIIDDRCGAAFGGILADLDSQKNSSNLVVDSGSTVASLKPGDSFSHLLVTSHECDYVESEKKDLVEILGSAHRHTAHHYEKTETLDGGSLFAYKVPEGQNAWKTEQWTRTTVFTGFKVKGQFWNVINPGAPGFVYTFHAKKEDATTGKRPMIAIAGDCAESAYIFRPEQVATSTALAVSDPKAQYKLMCEIKCGATVGSIAIGYADLCTAAQESGYAKVYIPCYEKDKILVFAMGSGEEEEDYDGW